MIKYIFFDFDGTVSDAKKLAYDKMSEALEEEGIKFSKTKLRKLMGAKTREIFGGLNIERNKFPEIRRSFHKKFVKGVTRKTLKLCSSPKPLYQLKGEGIKLIVLSNARKKYLVKTIKILGIRGLFTEVYGSRANKTKDQILKKLFRRYNIKPKETLYVGDRFSDINYAHKAHCHAVAIHNKCAWSTKKEILAENPDYIISDFKDLKELVEKLNS
jgi:phosphoglycolate phosphatase